MLYLDSLRSLTTAGQSIVYVTLDDSTPPDQVGKSWYQARKKVGDMISTLAGRRARPFFNDDFGDTFGIIYGSHPMALPIAKSAIGPTKPYWLLKIGNTGKSIIGTQDETIYIDQPAACKPGPVASDRTRRRTPVLPAGLITSAQDRTILQVSGSLADDNLRQLKTPTASGLGRDTAVRNAVDPPSHDSASKATATSASGLHGVEATPALANIADDAEA